MFNFQVSFKLAVSDLIITKDQQVKQVKLFVNISDRWLFQTIGEYKPFDQQVNLTINQWNKWSYYLTSGPGETTHRPLLNSILRRRDCYLVYHDSILITKHYLCFTAGSFTIRNWWSSRKSESSANWSLHVSKNGAMGGWFPYDHFGMMLKCKNHLIIPW